MKKKPSYTVEYSTALSFLIQVRRSNRLFKCTYSVINNWLLFGLTIGQNRKAVVVLRHTFTYEKKLIQRIIYVGKEDPQKKE